MIRALFGPEGLTAKLRAGLDVTMADHRGIADRIASARSQSASNGFGQALEASAAKLNEADLVRDMTQLADTEIRYETEARLLAGVYSGLRKAISGNG
jgi:hypothetical protein